jgi:hypothetical protein
MQASSLHCEQAAQAQAQAQAQARTHATGNEQRRAAGSGQRTSRVEATSCGGKRETEPGTGGGGEFACASNPAHIICVQGD